MFYSYNHIQKYEKVTEMLVRDLPTVVFGITEAQTARLEKDLVRQRLGSLTKIITNPPALEEHFWNPAAIDSTTLGKVASKEEIEDLIEVDDEKLESMATEILHDDADNGDANNDDADNDDADDVRGIQELGIQQELEYRRLGVGIYPA